MTKLNEFIMTKILTEKSDDIDESKYNEVIGALSDKTYTNAICNYILVCAREKCINTLGEVNPREALNIMSAKFCVDTAYQYLAFLQNSHEYVEHEYRRA